MGMGRAAAHIVLLLAAVCKSGAKDIKEMCLSSASKKGCFDQASAECGSKWEEEDPSSARFCSVQDRFCLVKYSRVHRDCCIKTFCKGSVVSPSQHALLICISRF